MFFFNLLQVARQECSKVPVREEVQEEGQEAMKETVYEEVQEEAP